jgi:hypothetical protein
MTDGKPGEQNALTDEQIADLQTLRVAARQREWNTLQDTLKRLLTGLDPLIALTIPARQAQKFLPRFEKEYPEALWVRELLLTVIAYASAPKELPQHAINQFPSPGCGNFILAVFDMARAVQEGQKFFERYSHITNATANAVVADLQYFYFNRHSREYERLHDEETTGEERADIQQEFWVDRAVSFRDAATWLEIADDVEARLTEN